jgi:hypothetical protein
MYTKLTGRITLLALLAVSISSCKKELAPATANLSEQGTVIQRKSAPAATASLFSSGFNDPRGLKFGSDGNLYVAEAGIGGTISSAGFNCAQAPPPFGPYFGSLNGGRVSRVNASGMRTTVGVMPSARSSIDDNMGPADVAFINNEMYVLQNAGCSRGLPNNPSGVYKMSAGGVATLVANLSAWQAANPVAQPEVHDFEPDGAWYNLVAAGGDLYALDANHGEIVKVKLDGTVSRLVDVSAVAGHIVPTAMDYRGNFYVANLGTFPIMGNSVIYKVNPKGLMLKVAEGLSAVLGLVIDQQSWMYVLEMTAGAPFPNPGLGRIVAISPSGVKSVILTGLNFPTGMTMGADGNLYVSSWGFGMPPGGGQITKVTLQ